MWLTLVIALLGTLLPALATWSAVLATLGAVALAEARRTSPAAA